MCQPLCKALGIQGSKTPSKNSQSHGKDRAVIAVPQGSMSFILGNNGNLEAHRQLVQAISHKLHENQPQEKRVDKMPNTDQNTVLSKI